MQSLLYKKKRLYHPNRTGKDVNFFFLHLPASSLPGLSVTALHCLTNKVKLPYRHCKFGNNLSPYMPHIYSDNIQVPSNICNSD